MATPHVLALLIEDIRRANPDAVPVRFTGTEMVVRSGRVPIQVRGAQADGVSVAATAMEVPEGTGLYIDSSREPCIDHESAGVTQMFLPRLRQLLEPAALPLLGLVHPWPTCPRHPGPEVFRLTCVDETAFWICPVDPEHQVPLGRLGL